MDGKIRAEWDTLKKVVIHSPGIEMFMGLLEPYSSLYERAFSQSGAKREHEMMGIVLNKEFDVEVILLKQAIIEAANKKPSVKKALIDLARESLEYSGDKKMVADAKREFEHNLKYFDTTHFFNIILLNPLIKIQPPTAQKSVDLNITERHPLANLYFMRDQQFVTEKGIVLCRLAKEMRRYETRLTKFLWQQVMGLDVICEIEEPGTIEGGEFLPMDKFAMIGIGSRTNQSAIDQILKLGLNYEEIAVVHQPMHPLVPKDQPDPMINMHLDTYFNVASKNVVIGCELLLKNAKVDIYKNEGYGKYVKDAKTKINLYDYIKKKGFEVINVTTLEQLCYASNFLCIKNGVILAVEAERNIKNVLANLSDKAKAYPARYGKLLAQAKSDYEYVKNEGQIFPHKKELYKFGIEVYPLNIPNLTGGYGAAHCMTCSLTRG